MKFFSQLWHYIKAVVKKYYHIFLKKFFDPNTPQMKAIRYAIANVQLNCNLCKVFRFVKLEVNNTLDSIEGVRKKGVGQTILNHSHKAWENAKKAIGESNYSYLIILVKSMFRMAKASYGSLFVMPRILLQTDREIWDRILAIPVLLVHLSSGFLKPSIMIVEPFIRTMRYVVRGDHKTALKLGMGLAEEFGYPAWDQGSSSSGSSSGGSSGSDGGSDGGDYSDSESDQSGKINKND